MLSGYTRPLYILPFDHRHSYETKVFGYHEPLTAQQQSEIAHSKEVIYAGFKAAIEKGVPRENAGLLVDEEFGAAILEDALQHRYITAMPLEKSGQDEFDFEYPDYAARLQRFDPTFAKVLVRYNPEGDADMNRRQAARLHQLSEHLRETKRLFMFELLVPAEKPQLAAMGNDSKRYDLELRPGLMVHAIQQLQEAGVNPDVWKIEGLDRRSDCEEIVRAAQRGGRYNVGCIVLGRGEDEKKVLEWLTTAASVRGFIGFAVGRSSFLQAIVELQQKKIDRDEAIERIAAKFLEWTQAFEKARGAAG
ncbi:MAG: 2-deoxy-5-keto-D-gluconate 6-phosphate aldolase domain-containing protein [Phycisphaerae bacterium]